MLQVEMMTAFWKVMALRIVEKLTRLLVPVRRDTLISGLSSAEMYTRIKLLDMIVENK